MTRRAALSAINSPLDVAAMCLVGVCVEAAIVCRFGWSAPLPAYCYFAAIATAVSAADLAARRIPNPIVRPAYIIGPALLTLNCALTGSWWPLLDGGIATAGLAGFYLALGFAVPAGMGLGDVKWAGVIGLYLGYLGWSALMVGTLLAFSSAAVLVVARACICRDARGFSVPMAPFMTAGALVAILVTR